MDERYMAGLIDADGSIGIARKRNVQGRFVYWLQVQLAMAEREVIEWVATVSNRSIYEYDAASGTRIFKVMWQGAAAVPLLKLIAPYLKGKHRQAALAVEFEELKKRPEGQRECALSLAERETYWESMRALNACAKEKHNGTARL